MPKPPHIAPPAATGNAGPQFEACVGAFYLLSLLTAGEPRGLSGAAMRTAEFQQRGSGHPLDDIIIKAVNADGSAAILEIQAKRSLTFVASDKEFKDVVAQIWEAAKKPEFGTIRYELAVAIARTTTRVEHACQEVLHWARQLTAGATFAAHISREKFSSKDMRDFVEVFRANLALAGGPTDDETVWRLLRSFQILPFDFESPGSDYEHRARERARLVLMSDQAERAAELWPVLIHQAGVCARAGGALGRPALVTPLEKQYGFRFDQRGDLRSVDARLAEAAEHALNEIKDQVGGVRLARTELIDRAYAALEQHRVVHLVGMVGSGKSSILKHLAQRLQPEGRIIVLRNGRIIPGGWLPMAHAIGCQVSQDELFNELGCGGGATLFVDNIDQIDEPSDWATTSDLLTGVARNPGWRAVVTGGLGNDEWKNKLPEPVRHAGIATLEVGAITDDEVAVLSEGNQALAVILSADHPARGIARNLFYLSRMIELGAGQAAAAAGIATEIDLARLWWRYGGGRAEDDGRFARLRVLRAMGAQVILNPSRAVFKVDELDSSTLASLLRFDSLQEDTKGATVAFRHDVLRDWTVGFLLHENKELLSTLPMDGPIATGLARGLEIAARLALDSDPTGAEWLTLLNAVDRAGAHGSWKRPVLLALPRSEQALVLFISLKSVLLESGGRRLSEIIRLMIAVESVPLATVLARVQPAVTVPPGVDDFIVPKGLGWTWLVMWLVAEVKSLPTELIPDVAKVFQAWLISTQNQPLKINSDIVGILFEWLALVADEMVPRMFKDISEVPPSLNIPHLTDVRNEIRMSAFAFARLNPTAAAGYLAVLDPDSVRHREAEAILTAPGSLTQAAPAELADFALGALIEKDDPDEGYRSRHDRYGPFGVNDYMYSRASPSQGPFLDLLEHAPTEGLRLIRGLVEHATGWQREQYTEARRPFPRVTVPFPTGPKSFEGDEATYHWARSVAPSAITASALMALEAWGHRQIESGRPFEDVLHDVLGPDGTSIAFVSVAVDLVLSHWPTSRNAAWPIMATPEILQFDNARYIRDFTGANRMSPFKQEANTARVKRADLDARSSRRTQLTDTFAHYIFRGGQEQLAALRGALEQARNEIKQKPIGNEDPIHGLHATAKRALRMTDLEHWPLVKVRFNDGSEGEVRQFQIAPEELRLKEEKAAHANASMEHLNLRLRVQAALFDRDKSTPAIVLEGIDWAKRQTGNTGGSQTEDDDDDDDFGKEWDRRVVVMAAALAVRDYEASNRDDVIQWARPILQTASTAKDKEYYGNNQIEYNTAAIAALGLVTLFLRDKDIPTRDRLMRLACHQHPAVERALGQHFPEFAQVDERMPRALIRIVIANSIHPNRTDSDDDDRVNQRLRQERVEAAIVAEQRWLNGAEGESAWPDLPSWRSRPRRGIRLGGWTPDDDDDLAESEPDEYVDEHALGLLASNLIRLTIGVLPPWIIPLSSHLMQWTFEANGPHGANDRDRDNRPSTWNLHFFEFAGIMSVALPHGEVIRLFVAPITQFRDEAFYDAMAAFLHGFDRATQATDTKMPENPAAIRRLLGDRIQQGWNFKRYEDEKTFSSERHAGDALSAMFYQRSSFASDGTPSTPANWNGLDLTIATLTDLVIGVGSSGYLAVLFLNLIESSPRAALLPNVVQAMTAWCSAYGADTNFWSEKDIGGRACGWLDRMLQTDPAAAKALPSVANDLMKCLDILIQSGVVQASGIEERIRGMTINRRTAYR
jgi:energy-coupling factor transporter ATP-binding protein EcfA2